jgi:hypothetical protein
MHVYVLHTLSLILDLFGWKPREVTRKPVCSFYKPYFFSERTVFFFHNKSANSAFSHDVSAKRTELNCLGVACLLKKLKIFAKRTVDLDLPTYAHVDCTCARGRLALTRMQDGQAKSLSLRHYFLLTTPLAHLVC